MGSMDLFWVTWKRKTEIKVASAVFHKGFCEKLAQVTKTATQDWEKGAFSELLQRLYGPEQRGTKHLINIYYVWPLHCFYLLAGSGPRISLRELLLPHSQLARLGWSCPSSGGHMPRTWLVQPHIPQSERLGQRGTHDTKQPVRVNSRTLPEIIKEDTSCYFIYHRK